MKPVWPGPIEGGITQSLITKMLECPYRAFLYFCLGLEEPRILEPNLIWGNGFHLGLEKLIHKPALIKDLPKEEFDEVAKEITAYLKHNYPNFPPTFPYSIASMLKLYDDSYKLRMPSWETEKKFVQDYTTRSGNKCTLRGKADGYAGNILVEHKCKGKIDPVQTREETPFDLQVLLYSYVLNTNITIYDLIRIPEAQYWLPPRNPLAKASGYVDVMFNTASDWKDYPISRKKHLWLYQAEFEIPDERIDGCLKYTLDPIIDYITALYDLWCEPSFDPENPDCYGPLFYRTPIRQFDPTRTDKYKCNYHSLLTDQIGMNELVPVTSYYAELDDE